MIDFIFNLTPGDVVYDIETYPNCFTFTAIHCETEQVWRFEISPRRNDLHWLCLFMDTLARLNCRMVGFNSESFDYPVIHSIHQGLLPTVEGIYSKAMAIIKGRPFDHMVWADNRVVTQLDLFKIHHFDNMARSTSLKMLEFNMRMDNIEDLPFPVGTTLTSEQMDILLAYNLHDCRATLLFYRESIDKIRLREEVTVEYGIDCLNFNDTKIGKQYFIQKLEEHTPGCCYKRVNGVKRMVQTVREQIVVKDILLDYIHFTHPEFQRIHQWFKDKIIVGTKGVIKDINCTVNGFQFDFGTGGIHGSVEPQVVHSDDQYCIIDIDVASYYPNLAIANGLYPAHLGEAFCDIYADVYKQRQQHAKGTAGNAMLKLALNGTYGDSNNEYSPLYDPQYTMAITVNGQLLLCMLAEVLMANLDVQMIQVNTDGVTIRCPHKDQQWVSDVCRWWESVTKLTLEEAVYSRMFIRDVNNYIAEYEDGKLKRKGAYEYELDWHQNHSALIVKKAAEAALVHGEDIREFITGHADTYDFFLRAKVPRASHLELGNERVGNIVRYYISTAGRPLEKVMPPAGPEGEYKRANCLTEEYYQTVKAEIGSGVWDERIHTKNKSVYETRRMGINTGWMVTLQNKTDDIPLFDLNYEWYIKEAEKLVNLMKDD